MKLQIASDLHIEFHVDGGAALLTELQPEDGIDALILAGDIGVWREEAKLVQFLSVLASRFPQVFYVPGNHEFYHREFSTVRRELRKRLPKLGKTFRLLETGSVFEWRGRRFLGDTMWFTYQEENAWYGRHMNDFELIRNFTPQVYQENSRFQKYLHKELREGDIVVTHHLPSMLSVPAYYKASETNRFFVCPMGHTIAERKPALWVHGHTHSAVDYRLDQTRVVANPFGYPDEATQAKFHPLYTVEV